MSSATGTTGRHVPGLRVLVNKPYGSPLDTWRVGGGYYWPSYSVTSIINHFGSRRPLYFASQCSGRLKLQF
jgi:hypothetical protein